MGKDLLYPSVDVLLTFVVTSGEIDVYISTDSMAVQVFESENGIQSHRIVIPDRVKVVSQSRKRSVVMESVRASRTDEVGDEVGTSPRGEYKREAILPPASLSENGSTLFRYLVRDRLTLSIPHETANFGNIFYYVTIFAQDETLLYFEFFQPRASLNFYIFFGLFFSTLTFMSSMLLGSWRFIRFVIDRRQAYLERKRRERQANRPLYSVILYLHDGTGNTRISTTKAHAPLLSSKELEYQEVDKRLRSKSLLILDGKPTYITRRKGRVKKESTRESSNSKKGKKNAVMKFDLSDLGVWPVTMQPTADERASVHSLLVQLPTAAGKSSSHSLCVGSSLVTYADGDGEREGRGGGRRRGDLRGLRERDGGEGGERRRGIIEMKNRRSRDYISLNDTSDTGDTSEVTQL